MAIILEGPNGVGKSTIARKLKTDLTRFLNKEFRIQSYRKNSPLAVYEDNIIAMREATQASLIMDRFPCVSESIYGGFPGTTLNPDNTPQIATSKALDICKHYVGKGTLFVHIFGDDDFCYRRQKCQRHTFSEYQEIASMYFMFFNVIGNYMPNQYIHHYNKNNYSQLIYKILNFLCPQIQSSPQSKPLTKDGTKHKDKPI